MSVKHNRTELLRLRDLFEGEAAKFHATTISVLYFTQEIPKESRVFSSPNHTIMLWQYYGALTEEGIEPLARNVVESDLSFGLRGSQFSCVATIEGENVDLFVRMATRAGLVFSSAEADKIKMRAGNDFKTNLAQGKSVFVSNSNALAVWINNFLYDMGLTHPGRGPEMRVSIDPFTASLRAIDALLSQGSRPRRRKSNPIEHRRFDVALTFPGARRYFVAGVAEALVNTLGDKVFYDMNFQSELARPNLDLVLQSIYRKQSNLVAVFLSAEYSQSEWCGLEWRAVRDIIKQGPDEKIMLFRFDDAPIDGIFGIDGYIDVRQKSPSEVADAIVLRTQ